MKKQQYPEWHAHATNEQYVIIKNIFWGTISENPNIIDIDAQGNVLPLNPKHILWLCEQGTRTDWLHMEWALNTNSNIWSSTQMIWLHKMYQSILEKIKDSSYIPNNLSEDEKVVFDMVIARINMEYEKTIQSIRGYVKSTLSF